MKIELINIDKLKPAKYNPRKDLKPGDPEYEKLKRSIDKFGYVEPLVWNERTGNLIAGHQRLKILKSNGLNEVEVVIVDLDENEEKALNIALNKISGDWDIPLLTDCLKDLKLSSFDVELTGFTLDDVSFLLNTAKKPDAQPKKEKEKLIECPHCKKKFPLQ